MRRFFFFIPLRSPWFWLGTGLAAILIRGLFLDVMDVDAAQYASISMEMLQNGSWLQVQHRGADYLDKPPLLFWLSAASYALFGISNWAYKLPSLLAALAGVWGVYRFCLLFYSPKTARQAAFILASSLGLIIICNDVRTDTLLLGATTCAVWQLAGYLRHGRWRYLFGGFVFVGLAMLAKGPIGLVVPAFAVGAHLMLSGRWREIFRWQWLAGLAVTALVLAPMCAGLWQQFELHPEKVVNGRTGVSGLYFFFWEQSFGRITGENVWRNDTSAFYFLHVYLWAFLPWCLLLPAALWRAGANAFAAVWPRNKSGAGGLTTFPSSDHYADHDAPPPQTSTPSPEYYTQTTLPSSDHYADHDAPPPQTSTPSPEYYTPGAFVLTFVALSMSQYKLPHYIFITLPWAAVLVARHLDAAGARRWGWAALYGAIAAGLLIAYLLPGFVFPGASPAVWGILLAATGGLAVRIFRNPFPAETDLLVQRGVWAALICGFAVNFYFYPHLLPYQAAKSVAQYVQTAGIPRDRLAFFHRGSHALDFYNRDIVEDFEAYEAVRAHAKTTGVFWLQADEAGKGELEINGVRFEVVKTFHHFQVALLKAPFLDPAKRDSTLEAIYLLKILQEQE